MVMLKNIPSNISPDLMHALMSMGHGDEIVIADGNFPAASCAQKLIRTDGEGIISVLDSIMKFLPVDPYVPDHCVVMQVTQRDKERMGRPPIWAKYEEILKREEGDWVTLTECERFAFYERAKKAYVIVATSDNALYANIIIKKGVIAPK